MILGWMASVVWLYESQDHDRAVANVVKVFHTVMRDILYILYNLYSAAIEYRPGANYQKVR